MRVERWVAVALLGVGLAACGGQGVIATVDGWDVTDADIAALHPDTYDLSDTERAASLFLVILHQTLVEGARRDFGIVADPADIEAAFLRRTDAVTDGLDDRLAAQGVSAVRIRLEAELDVIRHDLSLEFVRRGGPEVDLAAAHRQFLSVNARSCLLMLAPSGPELDEKVETLVDGGATIPQIKSELGSDVEEVDLGCASPAQHPLPLAPIAVDGEVGKAYALRFSDGTLYVVAVTERDAPALENVMSEVMEIAAETQGRDLFESWALSLLDAAEVQIDRSVGRWEATPDTNGAPTVVAP